MEGLHSTDSGDDIDEELPPYRSEEFTLHHLYGGPGKSCVMIEHTSSKMKSRVLDTSGLSTSAYLTEREQLLEELKRKLAAEGIQSQPPPVANKKIGKPRWSKEKKSELHGERPEE